MRHHLGPKRSANARWPSGHTRRASLGAMTRRSMQHKAACRHPAPNDKKAARPTQPETQNRAPLLRPRLRGRRSRRHRAGSTGPATRRPGGPACRCPRRGRGGGGRGLPARGYRPRGPRTPPTSDPQPSDAVHGPGPDSGPTAPGPVARGSRLRIPPRTAPPDPQPRTRESPPGSRRRTRSPGPANPDPNPATRPAVRTHSSGPAIPLRPRIRTSPWVSQPLSWLCHRRV